MSGLSGTNVYVGPSVDRIKDQIGEQLRGFLLSMIPQQALDEVVETSWRKLTEPRPETDYSGRPTGKTRPSELEEMVMAAMREQMKNRVAEWAAEWKRTPACELGAKTMFSELVEAAATGFVQRVAVGIVTEAAATLASNAMVQTVSCSCGATAISGARCGCGAWC
ncbi:MAG: hypothetical protein AB7L09_03050 [Nitrospira sp.]